MQAVKGIQIRREKLGSHRIAGADDQCAQQKLLGLGEFVLSRGDQPQGAADILIEHLSLAGESDAPGAAGEEPRLQRCFQLLDGLADCRLRDIQVFRGHRDVAGFGHLLKHAIELQLDCHGNPSVMKCVCPLRG